MTFIQRFGDALNLNLHFHSLVLDGVFESASSDTELRFHPLPPPDDSDVERTALRIARGLARLLERRSIGLHSDIDDPLGADDPVLAALYAASVRGRLTMGPRAGQRPLRLGDRVDADVLPDVVPYVPRCANVGGVSLHANVAMPANDRARLERLCRYVARPPLASERLERLPDGRLLYHLRHRWRDGTTHFVFEPLELLERLAALVPPPRVNMVRYHGILAPAARDRARVVPARGGSSDPATRHADCPGRSAGPSSGIKTTDTGPVRHREARSDTERAPSHPRRYSWAELMRRVFAVDVLICPRCSGGLRILATIHPPATTKAILECLDLSTRPPPLAPANPSAGHAATLLDS